MENDIVVKAGYMLAAENHLKKHTAALAEMKTRYADREDEAPEIRTLEGYLEGYRAALYLLNIGDYRE